jgi:(1->4)-alpha-D-glucan 1-alpha-D-glucosylmutase
MLPFFGKPLNELIQDNDLTVVFNGEGFKLKYFENEYPLSIPAYAPVLKAAGQFPPPDAAALFLTDEDSTEGFEMNRRKLSAAYRDSAEFRQYIDACLTNINSDQGKLKEVIEKLHYYPSFWRDTETKINYRRFFTINSLICLNIQKEEVFSTCHRLIEEWIKNKLIDGLRVDHIDGLYNPTEYLERLRKLAGNEAVIYVEKILEEDETLPGHWPVQGSTGYDFLSLANNLLTNRDTGPLFNSFYSDWIHKPANFEDVFYSKSRFILYKRLAGELDNLTRQCLTLQSGSQNGNRQAKNKGSNR